MLNVSAIPLDEISPIWDDGFLLLSKSLLSAVTLDDFIHKLNKIDASFGGVTRVNLILNMGADEEAIFYFMGHSGPKHLVCPKAELHLSPRPTKETPEQAIILAAARFENRCPALDREGVYGGLRSYCQLPITTARSHLGGVEFINTQLDSFTMETLAKLTQLAAIIAIALENVLDKERTLEQANSLRLERDSCKILVDVTNAVIKLVRIAELPKSLFAILHHHFGISSLCLAEYNATSDSFKSYLVNQHQSDQPGIIDHSCFEKKCLQGALGHSEPFFVYREHGHCCSNRCRFTSQILPPEADSSCILPLRYRGNLLGVLILSHPNADFFADIDISLLEQVAARTAIAMNNVQAQQEISNTTGAREKTIRINEPQMQGEFPHIIYQSAVMESVLEKVRLVAESDSTVLILGETGTGKELIAQAIHALSARHDHEMVKVNCAAIPTGLIESDLFGHEKGAFTGALTQRIGRFERAHKGTLFLDEVGDMPLDLQPKLLRVLQEHELERVGNSNPIAVDVRLVAATNCDLLSMVKNKRFRSDLYYRLNVFPIELPPLRERREDIPLLVNFFIKKIAKRMRRTITSIPADAMKMLVSLPWYGNIRELENVIERAVVMTRGHVLNLSPDELMPLKGYHKIETLVYDEPATPLFAEEGPIDEREAIITALRDCNGIVAGERGAANRLGMKRTTLLSKMKRLGISARDPEIIDGVAP
ncbi:sigma 54-interacting transcriptional regulator [Aeromonas veronii]|uniref:sigma 54-interacting transcriptional regulator n=1 Tax=Aeromonas TaxID=642 RepID=UPI0015EB9178|nr:sigma 54-interacting transcriptional regulator [Aeromonas veronii]MBA2798698.1 sigma 54-interacting transcriptional regulator [Aeromonas veronii]MCX0442685.1 sigma 54-interacting transcriptional regulator [Aeromonas veronii]